MIQTAIFAIQLALISYFIWILLLKFVSNVQNNVNSVKVIILRIWQIFKYLVYHAKMGYFLKMGIV